MAHPTPIPTHLKVLAGNPGKKKLPAKEPKPKTPAGLDPPPYLSDDAVKIWKAVIPEYQAMGLLYQVDVAKVAMYCDSIATYERLTKEIAAEGEVIHGFNKAGQAYVLQNPKTSLKHQAFVRVQKLGTEIGDSPSARARLGKLLDDDKDEIDDLLSSKPT